MLTIRAARPADYPAIARIQQCCPEAAQWPVGDYSNFNVLLAEMEGQPVGFLAWRQTTVEEAELLNLAVDPAVRRKGVAQRLLGALAESASGACFLEVAENNSAARKLYEADGWVTVSVRKNYYEGGKTSAIVMKKGS